MSFDWAGTAFRIDRLQPDGTVLLVRLTDENLRLSSRDELLLEYGAGRISATIVSCESKPIGIPLYSRPLDELPPEIHAETRRRHRYVQALLDGGGGGSSARVLKPLITKIATEIEDPKPPSVTTLYRWLSRYRALRDARALIPRTDQRGAKTLRQDDRILALAAEATEDAYKASPLSTVTAIYDRLAAKITAENQTRFNGDALKMPALRTMYRILSRLEAYDRIVLREGKVAADKRLRINRSAEPTTDILERVEIDHTPLDLFLIDERTWLPLGRPTLTVVVDHFSRMLLGYSLSFGDPSTAAVMAALRHAILPKQPGSDGFPELPIEHKWPCYGRPDLIVVDNGREFYSNSLDQVSMDLGVKIHFCPKHQPRFKGTVERYLKTVNYSFAHQLPGTSFARWHLRGDYDPQKHAVLTLAEFRHVFEKWVVDVHAQQLHRGIATTPWTKWHEGLQRREPELPADLRQFQQRIGLNDERSLRRDGIVLNGIRYRGDELQPILSAYGEGVRVRIAYDPYDLGAIQVWGPEQEVPVTVLAVDQTYAAGLTEHQNKAIRASLREQGESDEDTEALQRAKTQLSAFIQDLMVSRKQKHRRHAAKLRGDRAHQSTSPEPVPLQLVAIPPKKKPAADVSKSENVPVPAYPRFILK
jgi:putative transposase